MKKINDTDGDKDLIPTRFPSGGTKHDAELLVYKDQIGLLANLASKLFKVETPYDEAIRTIKAAASNHWIIHNGVVVKTDGTFEPRSFKVLMEGDCLSTIILEGERYHLEGNKYIYRFSVGDINYADVLSVAYDDDEEEEVIDITHLMGDLTPIPF